MFHITPRLMRLSAVCLFFCLLLSLLPARAEEGDISVDFTGRNEGYSAVLYDNTSGLPTSEANAVAQTREGFLWIGSYSGLIRYDGSTFERYDSTTGIASVVSLFVDSRDRLWIGTNDNGVAVMEQDRVRMFHKADGLGSSTIPSIAEDTAGNIFVATTQGVSVISPSMELRTIDDPAINGKYVRQLCAGPGGMIYGVAQNDGVFTLSAQGVTSYYSKEELGLPDVVSVLPDPKNRGRVYLGTEHNEVYYGDLTQGADSLRRFDAAPLDYINAILRVGEQIWLCADNGVGIWENDTLTVLENIPMNNSIEHMLTDYEGNLWFTSSRQGVMKIVPNQFADLFERFRLPPAVVNSTCLYQGRLFVGTDTGLTVLEPEQVLETLPLAACTTASGEAVEGDDLIALLDGCRVRSILRDEAGNLWLSTFSQRGLIRYDGERAVSFTSQDGLPSDRVRTIYPTRDGRILAVCSGGVAELTDGQVTRVYNEEDGLYNTTILTVAESPEGDLIFGSDGDGIFVLREDGLLHIGAEEGLRSEIILRVKRDPARELYWVVTSNSLAYLTLDYQLTTVEQFPYPNNFDLFENSHGELWVLSSNGIYVTSADELTANGHISPIFYSRDNGMPCLSTANSYSECTQDGILYLSGSTGVAKVDIETPFTHVSQLKMAVPYLEADGARIYPGADGSFTLPAGVKKLTIYPFAFTYSLMNPQVTYWLDGFDQERTTLSRSELGPVDYTNLSGGSYRFVLELEDPLSGEVKELDVGIEKERAFYEMPWFYVLCALALLLCAAGAAQLIISMRLRAFQKKEEEQKTFIREITEAFAKVIDMKDNYTNGHSSRVAKYTAMLTRELGYDEETVERYYRIALLHDIGKVGVPSDVLNKPGKLTDEEFAIIKSHSAKGYEALKDISIMPELAIGAGAHHERPDGKGYPNGLSGEQIPRVAQIIAVADCFDAMYSTRPYRKRMNFERAVGIIREVSGTQLTPDVVDAFLRLVEQGEFRAPDDHGGGTVEDINNIHKAQRSGENNS